jgi:uncharacterized protein (TIRG00374 family)
MLDRVDQTGVLIKKPLALVLKLLVAVGILSYIFTIIPFSDVLNTLFAANLRYVAIAFFFQVVIRYIGSLRMKLITDAQGMALSRRQIFETSLITNFYGLFLPGSVSGGGITWYRFSQLDGRPSKAFASIVFNRLVEIIVVVAVGLSFWILDLQAFSDYKIGLYLVLVLGGLLACYVLFFAKKTPPLLTGLVRKLVAPDGPQFLRRTTVRLVESVTRFHGLSRSTLISILSISLSHVIVGVLSVYLYTVSLGLDLSAMTVTWIRSFVYVVTLIPISFSGLGVREGTLVLLLAPYGVSPADAVAWSLLFFAGTLFVACIGAVIEARVVFSSTSYTRAKSKKDDMRE